MRHHSKILDVGLLALWVTSTAVAAQTGLADLDVPTSPDTMVLSLTYRHSLLPENDPTPMLRIYGDGRVRVHYPDYMRQAGDYETYISRGRLRQILLGMADRRVLDFDRRAVEADKRQEQGRRAERGEFFHISDETQTILEINLAWYRPTGAGAQINNLRKTIRWGNLLQEADLFPGIPELRELADTEQELRSLLESDDLRRVP